MFIVLIVFISFTLSSALLTFVLMIRGGAKNPLQVEKVPHTSQGVARPYLGFMVGVFPSGVGEACGMSIEPRQDYCYAGGTVRLLSISCGYGECCNVLQWCPWRSQHIFRCIFSPVDAVSWEQFLSKSRHCIGETVGAVHIPHLVLCGQLFYALSLPTVRLIHNKNDAREIFALNFAGVQTPNASASFGPCSNTLKV